MLSRILAFDVGTATVIGGVVTVFAGTDPITFRLHAVQRSALALLGGGVASAYGCAQRQDERSSVPRGGVTVFTCQDPVEGRSLRG